MLCEKQPYITVQKPVLGSFFMTATVALRYEGARKMPHSAGPVSRNILDVDVVAGTRIAKLDSFSKLGTCTIGAT